MLRSLKNLGHYKIRATDGDVGAVKDLLFDDQSWKVRYLVALAGSWLSGRRVLLATDAFQHPEGQGRVFPVDVSKEQIASSPGLDTDPPVSRQHEIDLHEHYRWLPYWPTKGRTEADPNTGERSRHLRSVRQILGYRIHAVNEEIGHVEDLIADEEDWTIRYVVVDTTNHWPGGEVLVAPDWFEGFEWAGRKALVNVPAQQLRDSPKYSSREPVNRAVEERLYDYHGRPRYWSKDRE